MTADSIALLGHEVTVLGEVAVGAIGARAGVALSRGRFPKQGKWVDPNEDAVLAARAGDRWLLVAADGHFGFDAALAAVSSAEANVSRTLGDDRDGRLVVAAVMRRARAAVTDGLSAAGGTRSESRTAFSAVLVRPGDVFAATCGDSSVFRIRGGRIRALTPKSPFMGPNTPTPPVTRTRLRPGDGLAAVTDGFTDFLGNTMAGALCREVAGSTPARAARALVVAALAAGAGDNVGVALLLPAATTGHPRLFGRIRR